MGSLSNELQRILFWVSLILPTYVYLGYPLLLASGLLGRRRGVRKGKLLPKVSVIVPARNEEKGIESKLESLLAQEYPKECLEILVGSDGSTDGTERIVQRSADRGVHLVVSAQPRGKSAVQNELVGRSSGSILVFTDADCHVPPEAVRRLVENFADSTVGLVSALPRYVNADATEITSNESLYLRYESWMRGQESDRGLLAMASGALFAMRRCLWQPLDSTVGDDFVLPLQTVLHGYRNVLEPGLVAKTHLTQARAHLMLRMKTRIVSKDLRGLYQNRRILNPLRTGAVAVALWSHKLLRWSVPYFLLVLFVSNLFLLDRPAYAVAMLLQGLFYTLALADVLGGGRHFKFPLSVATSFCVVNFGALLGTLHCLCGRTSGQWGTVR